MPRFLALITLSVLLLTFGSSAQAARVGVASVVKNQVNGSVAGVINVGTGVSENEVISTGVESSTQLLFRDETSLTIGPSSRLTLDRFVYNPNTRTGDVVVNVLQGTFRFVSGSAKPGGYTIKTPAASIGLRGTVVEGFVNSAGELLLVIVEGSVVATTANGTSIVVSAGQYITISANGVVTGPDTWTGRTLDIESGQQFILDTDNPRENQRDQFNDALDNRDIDITFPPEKTDRLDTIKGPGIINSDMRLKKDVRHLVTLTNGIRVYAFRYLWDEALHVGVMAQDLIGDKRFAHAVHANRHGYYSVDYAALGLKMVSFSQWQSKGIGGLVLSGRSEKISVRHDFVHEQR